ncbi:hypothetical protein [Acaryochloris sp. IP29b_bin.148]|uniref:hypothetical protein n=1 Tax=Acaryochloris sp. IP29b_bin.148 TaxID=2969218 RepID=UPI00260FCC05|nr:hypothetical protein [Acaryochloris sp. IP29b_bin.148]
MNQEEIQRICKLYDGLGNILHAAQTNQVSATQSIDEMHKATERLEHIVRALKKDIQGELNQSITSVSNKISRDLKSQFSAAERNAQKAASAYEIQFKIAPFIYILIATSIGVAVVFIFGFFIQKAFPSLDEIQTRWELKKNLDSQISEMEAYINENKIDIGDCESRKCVRVNPRELDRRFGDDADYLILYDH